MDCSLPGSSVHGIFQARVLELLVISFSRGSSWPTHWTQVSSIADRHFTVWATKEALITWASPQNMLWINSSNSKCSIDAGFYYCRRALHSNKPVTQAVVLFSVYKLKNSFRDVKWHPSLHHTAGLLESKTQSFRSFWLSASKSGKKKKVLPTDRKAWMITSF